MRRFMCSCFRNPSNVTLQDSDGTSCMNIHWVRTEESCHPECQNIPIMPCNIACFFWLFFAVNHTGELSLAFSSGGETADQFRKSQG